MTTGKRQPPLWLDMDFAEAMERFAQTDPNEVASNKDAEASKPEAAPNASSRLKEKGRATRRRTRPV